MLTILKTKVPMKVLGLFIALQVVAVQAETLVKGSPEHIRAVTGAIDDAVLETAGEQGRDWLTYGRSYKEQRHSPLTQINKSNLGELGLAWTIDLGTKRGIQSTPLVVDGIMFMSGPWSVVYAIDARKGKLLWTFDPEVDRSRAMVNCCGVVNRGLAIYKGSVFVATLDGSVYSLDAADGSVNWEAEAFEADGTYYSSTGAIRLFDGKVLIGNGGAEFHARGYVSAFDAATGELAWRFYTVPGNPALPFEHPDLEEAAKTWTGEWWKQGGGGTAWDSMVYDPDLGLVYIGVGNGTHWDRNIRSPDGGDNLYLSSIVAVDVATGAYRWHYQTTPGDTWDYTATQPLTLAELEIEGKTRKVIMQAPKNGFFYVLDRETGEFLDANPYTYVNWASGIGEDGRPIEVPGARYNDGQARWITPGSHGAHNWQPQAYNPNTGLVYIPTVIKPGMYYSTANYGYGSDKGTGAAIGLSVSLDTKFYHKAVVDKTEGAPLPGQATGRLIAFDPLTMSEVWGVDMPLHYNGGLLSTEAGLVMQTDATGVFSIRDASTGTSLFSYDVRAGGIAPPVTYEVDGEQYITIAVGWGGGQGQSQKVFNNLHPGTIYTFKLKGTAIPPVKNEAPPKPLTTFAYEASELQVGHGIHVFFNNCMGCHAMPGTGGGAIPDLGRSDPAILANLEAIVLKGAYVSQGMPSFGHVLDQDDMEGLKAFIAFNVANLKAKKSKAEFMGSIARAQLAYDKSVEDSAGSD